MLSKTILSEKNKLSLYFSDFELKLFRHLVKKSWQNSQNRTLRTCPQLHFEANGFWKSVFYQLRVFSDTLSDLSEKIQMVCQQRII